MTIIHLTKNEEIIVQGMLNAVLQCRNTERPDGWLRTHEILESATDYKSQETNIDKYFKFLMNKNILERKRFDFVDKKRRKSKPYYYRIKYGNYMKITKRNIGMIKEEVVIRHKRAVRELSEIKEVMKKLKITHEE